MLFGGNMIANNNKSSDTRKCKKKIESYYEVSTYSAADCRNSTETKSESGCVNLTQTQYQKLCNKVEKNQNKI